MESITGRIAVVIALALGTGCAHIPDVSVNYYLAKTKPSFKVTRTVACDSDNNVIAGAVVVPTVTHHADTNSPVSVVITPLRGPLSDNDVKFDFYDDGRLKGVNVTTTGQAEGVLKTTLTVAATLGTFASTRADLKEICEYIAKTSPTAKSLTLTYEGEVDPEKMEGDPPKKKVLFELAPDLASRTYADKLRPVIGSACAQVLETTPMAGPVVPQKAEPGIRLKARQPALLHIQVKAGGQGGCSRVAWDGSVPVAQLGVPYEIPIPPAAWFGKQTFAATFQESGAMSLVQYTSTTGAGQLMNVVNQAVTEAQNEATRKAAALNAEAALIAAQQRVVRCKADPEKCT
jgi:hypothetical protein